MRVETSQTTFVIPSTLEPFHGDGGGPTEPGTCAFVGTAAHFGESDHSFRTNPISGSGVFVRPLVGAVGTTATRVKVEWLHTEMLKTRLASVDMVPSLSAPGAGRSGTRRPRGAPR